MTERQRKLWLNPESERELMRAQCLPDKLYPADVARMVLWLAALVMAFNLAAFIGPKASLAFGTRVDPEAFRRNNIVATDRVLAAAGRGAALRSARPARAAAKRTSRT